MRAGAPIEVMDAYLFPAVHYGHIGGKTFLWVYLNKPDWVDYTRVWNKALGFYEIWFDYCKRKEDDCSSPSQH